MKVKATLNGVTIDKHIPTSWDDVSFGQYVDIVTSDMSQSSIAAIILGLDKDTVSRVQVENLPAFIRALDFIDTQMNPKLPETILGYKVPKSLNGQPWGKYGDLMTIAKTMNDNDSQRDNLMKYIDIVAIYAMPDYLDTDNDQKDEFAKQFLHAPCSEVMAVGNFILMTLLELKMPTLHNYLIKGGSRTNRLKLAIRLWLIRSAGFIRSTIWNVRHRIAGTSL